MNQLLDPETMMSSVRLGPEVCIEFFGLPGSGKSTIAREVHAALARIDPDMLFGPDLLQDTARAPARVGAKLRLIFSEIIRDRAILGLAGRALVTRQPRVKDRLRAAFTVATVAALYASLRRHHRAAVVDQGLLQAVWSVQLRQPIASGGGLVSDLIKSAALSRCIHVSVETPAEECAKRLEARQSKHSRMQTAEGGLDLHTWEKAELLRRTILSDFRSACRKLGVAQHVIVIDGTTDPALAAGQIVAAFRQMRPVDDLPKELGNQGVAP